MEDALRSKQDLVHRTTTELDAIQKEKANLTLRLQVAEDQRRDLEHKLNSRVIGVEMENARLSENLDGVRDVAELAEEINSRIQRGLSDAGVKVPQHQTPTRSSKLFSIQRLLHNVSDGLLKQF